MTATSILRDEHELILEVLNAAAEAARRLQSGQSVDPGTLERMLTFLREFADRAHHGKEEDLLFPALVRRGMPSAGGPIGVMLFEHTQGRELIRRMAAAGEGIAGGAPGAGSAWANAARGYVELLRAHIAKENDILFVMADRILSNEEQAGLGELFRKVDSEKIGAAKYEQLRILAGDLLRELPSGAGASS